MYLNDFGFYPPGPTTETLTAGPFCSEPRSHTPAARGRPASPAWRPGLQRHRSARAAQVTPAWVGTSRPPRRLRVYNGSTLGAVSMLTNAPGTGVASRRFTAACARATSPARPNFLLFFDSHLVDEMPFFQNIQPLFPRRIPKVLRRHLSHLYFHRYRIRASHFRRWYSPGCGLATKRHQGRWNVDFCDGHVQCLTTKDLFDITNQAVLARWRLNHQ